MNISGLVFSAFFFLFNFVPVYSFAQEMNEVQRKTSRLERLTSRVWESLLEETRYGTSIDQRIQLDVFNFVNGVRVLKKQAEAQRTRISDLKVILELIQYQSMFVDRSLREAHFGRFVMRDWEDAKASLDSLVQLISTKDQRLEKRKRSEREVENTNNLKVHIREIRPVGNFFNNEYRVYGTISGRNIVSAGFYAQNRLVTPITTRLHEKQLTKSSFAVRLQIPEKEMKIRVIDSQGFVLEHLVEFPAKSLIPNF